MTKIEIKQPIIVLFEDDVRFREERKLQIQLAVGDDVIVVPYTGDEEKFKAPVEASLVKLLNTNLFNEGHIGLIVSDRELGKYSSQVVSDSIITVVAEQMGIPICLYERGGKATGTALAKFKQWKIKEIVVDGDVDNYGELCAGIYKGFDSISRRLDEITNFQNMTPPEILAKILDNEDEVDGIALYGAGEQSVLLELLPYYDGSKRSAVSQIKKRYPRVLGNWLYNSILRYPGILVNETAVASYLNISENDFSKQEVRSLFANAHYKGPFSSCGHWWWRRKLDRILEENECETGLVYAHKCNLTDLQPCFCEQENTHPAGYYDMISERPICKEHSRGGISWFPGGADLARISNNEYKKIGPFLGLY